MEPSRKQQYQAQVAAYRRPITREEDQRCSRKSGYARPNHFYGTQHPLMRRLDDGRRWFA